MLPTIWLVGTSLAGAWFAYLAAVDAHIAQGFTSVWQSALAMLVISMGTFAAGPLLIWVFRRERRWLITAAVLPVAGVLVVFVVTQPFA